jgi:hypothetical protein
MPGLGTTTPPRKRISCVLTAFTAALMVGGIAAGCASTASRPTASVTSTQELTHRSPATSTVAHPAAAPRHRARERTAQRERRMHHQVSPARPVVPAESRGPAHGRGRGGSSVTPLSPAALQVPGCLRRARTRVMVGACFSLQSGAPGPPRAPAPSPEESCLRQARTAAGIRHCLTITWPGSRISGHGQRSPTRQEPSGRGLRPPSPRPSRR